LFCDKWAAGLPVRNFLTALNILHEKKSFFFFTFRLAKENVEKHYAVVGLLEELDMTLEVLSHYIPRFFSGVTKFYASIREESRTVNKNIYRPKVNETIKDLVNEKKTFIS
jgi:hypothetical protein